MQNAACKGGKIRATEPSSLFEAQTFYYEGGEMDFVIQNAALFAAFPVPSGE